MYDCIKRNENGFTLLESIISVAMLAAVSVFILNMFIVSNRVNVKARDLDTANMRSMSVIEMFKGRSDPETFFSDGYFDGCEVSRNGQSTDVKKYFDGSWNETWKLELAVFLLEVHVEADNDALGMYSINTRVVRLQDAYIGSKFEENEMLNLETVKYFPSLVVMNGE